MSLFIQITFSKKFFREYHQIVKRFGSVGPDLDSKRFAKVFSRRQKSPLAGKESLAGEVYDVSVRLCRTFVLFWSAYKLIVAYA